jgi:hypothetical protein
MRMATRNCSSYADPLDVLRRFVPMPLKAMYRVGHLQVMVQTNDFALIPRLLPGTKFDASSEWDWAWKLVRDADATGSLAPAICLKSDTLTIVTMGTALVLGVDHERREVLGFIAADVDVHTYQEFLVPFIFQIIDGQTRASHVALLPERNEEFAND